MEQELKIKLDEQSKKIDAIYTSVEKTRKYFLIIIWVSVLGFLLPFIGILFAAPAFLSTYTSTLGGGFSL